MISRQVQDQEIIDAFLADNPAYQVCMITGLRGSGKTVSMTSIANEIRNNSDWIILDLNSERNMLQSMAAELCNRRELFQLFREAKINLSIFGLGLEIEGAPPITDEVVALDRMLERITKKGKKVLVTVDEAVSNQNMREFASQFQIFIRKNYNVFLLMTGLYENIYEIQNEKTLTFLYRAPKVELKPLNLKIIASNYKKIFNLSDEDATAMARITKGYPFAYQALGYICYKNAIKYDEALPELDMYLEEYVYEKVWNELSPKDKVVLRGMCGLEDSKVENIRQAIDMDSNTFNVYRKRLLKKGIIESKEYGYLSFVLPRFSEFVLGTE